jgi:hypothetical protein
MKKRLALLLACVLLVSAMMVACGSSTKVEGTTWKLTKAEMEGQTVEAEALDALGGESTFDFQKDGVLVGNMFGEEVKGTWKQSGSKVTLEIDGSSVDAKISGSKMTMEEEGNKLTFEKK